MPSFNTKNLSVAVTPMQAPYSVDLSDGTCYATPNTGLPSPSEPKSATSFYSQESSGEDEEEDIGDSKLDLDVTNIRPIQSDESELSDSTSEVYSSALSSPTRDIPPHLDIPSKNNGEGVRSFLDMDESFDEVPEDKLDLAKALTKARNRSSSVSSCESDYRLERDIEEIERDRRIYLGDDWAQLLTAIEAGVPLKHVHDKAEDWYLDEEFGEEVGLVQGMASFPTPYMAVFPH
ncbi:hypothetical protein VNI00_014543 [Paramarasmius palmivorus]|uniref:Uncharacterized protein n=1 Tax=Paramarasmius palmivorus TaxID=297713 RepID=A0AAW0BQL5_9AGAR